MNIHIPFKFGPLNLKGGSGLGISGHYFGIMRMGLHFPPTGIVPGGHLSGKGLHFLSPLGRVIYPKGQNLVTTPPIPIKLVDLRAPSLNVEVSLSSC